LIVSLIKKVFGTAHEREIKKLQPIVDQINGFEETMSSKTDDQLKELTPAFKDRVKNGEILDDILPEAFACVRETGKRVLEMRHFDVQLIGGIALHKGMISEMATGEGKTLVATLPAYLNSLSGYGVHIITVNDYLAKRDREWMGQIFEFLGLTVGVIHHDITQEERKEAYKADITYGTNTEFGFDYLRDNMANDAEYQVQGKHNFAIVDEVDSILIDEARTPLIISGPVERKDNNYFSHYKSSVENVMRSQNQLMGRLLKEAEDLLKDPEKEYEAGVKLLLVKRGSPKNKKFLEMAKEGSLKKMVDQIELDYIRDKRMPEIDDELYFSIDERSSTIDLSDKGRHQLSPNDPDFFIMPDLSMSEGYDDLTEDERLNKQMDLEKEFSEKGEKLQNISQLLKAYSLFEKDINYVLNEGKVMIVDEFTGRILPGRRYSDGLHQAIEAKEGVRIEGETQTLAAITIQNYFRMYKKLSGMTGTAETEAPEFIKIYKLQVMVMPTNKPVRRIDSPDVVFKTKKEKYRSVIKEIEKMNKMGRPVLVGTVSVETSELISRMIPKRIKHSVLNAKRHQEEASIIENAGQAGAVTIATNMAGRGTDIKLGPGVIKCQQCCLYCEIEKKEGCKNCPDPVKKGNKKTDCKKEVPCGLHIIGTERHDSRRIDRQLRGRAARQGDPGSSKFFLSLEDDLLRIFGAERISGIMDRFGMEEDEPIEHNLITRAIENAQSKVENHNFEMRKHLLEYDDVMNKQREIIYKLRYRALHDETLEDLIKEYSEGLLADIIDTYYAKEIPSSDMDTRGFVESIFRQFSLPIRLSADELKAAKADELEEKLFGDIMQQYQNRKKEFTPEVMHQLEKFIYQTRLDEIWKDNLLDMDHLREGIGLRGYAQQDPLREYQKEAYSLFTSLVERLKGDFIEKLFMVRAIESGAVERPSEPQKIELSRGEGQTEKKPIVRKEKKIGRNEPCPCGSGKKYKKCCGKA